MLSDVAALGLALLALWIASRAPTFRYTFGFRRSEVLAALLNGAGLVVVAGWVLFEAYRRFQLVPEVQAPLLLVIGGGGLAVNFGAALLLLKHADESLNVEAALLHVWADLLGSLGVIIAGVLIALFGWALADPLFGALIGLLILGSAVRLLRRVALVLMQGTSARINVMELCRRLEAVPGVSGVHDLHVWSVTSGYEVLSAHVTTPLTDPGQKQDLLRGLKTVAVKGFGVSHVTIQLEETADQCQEETHHIPHS
jgi:cobalt-zinc-cadmium efflux system protein